MTSVEPQPEARWSGVWPGGREGEGKQRDNYTLLAKETLELAWMGLKPVTTRFYMYIYTCTCIYMYIHVCVYM